MHHEVRKLKRHFRWSLNPNTGGSSSILTLILSPRHIPALAETRPPQVAFFHLSLLKGQWLPWLPQSPSGYRPYEERRGYAQHES